MPPRKKQKEPDSPTKDEGETDKQGVAQVCWAKAKIGKKNPSNQAKGKRREKKAAAKGGVSQAKEQEKTGKDSGIHEDNSQLNCWGL